MSTEQPASTRRRVVYLTPVEYQTWLKIKRMLGTRSEDVGEWRVSETPVVDLTPETKLGSQHELAAIERFQGAGLIVPVEGQELHFRLAIHPALLDVEQITVRRTMEVNTGRYAVLRAAQRDYNAEPPEGRTPYDHFVGWVQQAFPDKKGSSLGVVLLNYREGELNGLGIVRSFQGKKGAPHHVSMEGLEAYTFVETDGQNKIVEEGVPSPERKPAPPVPPPPPAPAPPPASETPFTSKLEEALAAVRGEMSSKSQAIEELEAERRALDEKIATIKGEQEALAAREQSLGGLIEEEAALKRRMQEEAAALEQRIAAALAPKK